MNDKPLYSKTPESYCQAYCSKCCANWIPFTPDEGKNTDGCTFDGKLLKYGGCVPKKPSAEQETIDLVQEYTF